MTTEKKKPATRKQIGRIVNMLLSGEIDRVEATEIIERDRKQDLNLAFWESRFPGKGQALMEVLRPFYDWKPELKPALPDLEEQAKQAVFWRDVSNVRALRRSEATVLEASLFDSFDASPEASFLDSLGTSRMTLLWRLLDDSFYESPGLQGIVKKVSLGFKLRRSFRPLLWKARWSSLLNPKFKSLLDLWLAGNFPVGFDKDGNLLVLVADPESE